VAPMASVHSPLEQGVGAVVLSATPPGHLQMQE
jgi:hypothetical protein